MTAAIEIQGHRGARARRPENTIPSFEAALDAGVGSIETDIQFTRDGDPVLFHDGWVTGAVCSVHACDATWDGFEPRRLDALESAIVRRLVAERNPAADRFPLQKSERTPLGEWFARQRFPETTHPYAVPFLDDLFEFVKAYAGEAGARHGKTPEQRANAARAILDLEIKNEPFDAPVPESALFTVAAAIRRAAMAGRCRARSFDHRLIRRFHELMPEVPVGALIAGAAVIDPVRLCRDAGATIYCPEYRSLDEAQVRQLRQEGIRVIPWTVNDRIAWRQLLRWRVDGICTDDPDELARFVRESAGQ